MNRWPSRRTPSALSQRGSVPRGQLRSRLLLSGSVGLLLLVGAIVAQSRTLVAVAQEAVEQQEEQLIRNLSLPNDPPPAPVYRPAPAPAPEPVYEPAPEPVYEAAPAPEPAPPAGGGVDSEPEAGSPAGEAAIEEAPSPASPGLEAVAKSKKEEAPTGPLSQYVLEFNRSPVVGNRLRLQGTFDEARIGFPKPRGWRVRSAKAVIRYQHSPSLLAKRSNLTVRMNGTSLGSVPLARKEGQIGEYSVPIRPDLLQDFNNLSVFVQQNTDPVCTNPADPTLWSEVLPDSRLVINYEPIPVPLDLKNYPYPFLDSLALGDNSVAYSMPATLSADWLTAAAQLQASLGRQSEFRPLATKLVKGTADLEWNDRLIVVGTPAEQPILRSLKLPKPFKLAGNQWTSGTEVLPDDKGILILATTPDGSKPILVVTGNTAAGVQQAVKSLQRPAKDSILAGQSALVNVADIPSPDPRNWPNNLPTTNRFKLGDRLRPDGEPFKDVTVRGSASNPVEIPFRALPDDRFLRGNSMNLVYSYGPSLNPRTSTVEVQLDGVAIAGKRLDSEKGKDRDVINVNLPENLIKPTSQLKAVFQLNSRETAKCGIGGPDQQLWATLHTDTSFDLKREQSVELPNLELAQVGFPFGAPQDLSQTGILLSSNPSPTEVLTLLEVSERLGRLTKADGIKLSAYMADNLEGLDAEGQQKNLVAIGLRDKFPIPEAFSDGGFNLGKFFSRSHRGDVLQTLPDRGGVIKEVISPKNGNRVILALAAQSEAGLAVIGNVFDNDNWFYRLKGDTVLVNANETARDAFDPTAYQLTILQESRPKRLEKTGPVAKISRLMQDNWFILPTSVVALSLLLYGVSQLLLKRAAGDK